MLMCVRATIGAAYYGVHAQREAKPVRDSEIFYKAVLALVDREMKVKTMTATEITEALILAVAKVIEAAPDKPQKDALRAKIYEYLERIGKGDLGLH
jgi:hypothetical protein